MVNLKRKKVKTVQYNKKRVRKKLKISLKEAVKKQSIMIRIRISPGKKENQPKQRHLKLKKQTF